MSDFINTIDVLGDDAVIDSIIDRSITEFKDNVITKIGSRAFSDCAALETVDLPNVTSLGAQAFWACSSLTSVDCPNITSTSEQVFFHCTAVTKVNLPNLTSAGMSLFYGCTALPSLSLPSLTNTNGHLCYECTSLKLIDLPKLSSIGTNEFAKCNALVALILRGGTICALLSSGALNNTPIASGTGYIYVPSALLDSYKAATNWSTYAAQFRALEDYTVDGTVTGELDETKI